MMWLALAVAVLCQCVSAFAPTGRLSFSPSIPPQFVSGGELGNCDTSDALGAMAFVRSRTGVSGWKITSNHTSTRSKVLHVYLRQLVRELEVANGEANVNVLSDGKVLSFADSSFKGVPPNSAKPALGAPAALELLATYMKLGGDEHVSILHSTPTSAVLSAPQYSLYDIPAKLVFVQTESEWFDAWVDATTGVVHAVNSYIADDSYEVFAPPVNDPDDGARSYTVHPADQEASPLGWHDQDTGTHFLTTIGNNVWAQENRNGGSAFKHNYRPTVDKDLDFTFPLDFAKSPVESENASVTNLFYLNNIIHDVFYLYGFDEPSGNFQEANFDRGGLGGDAVQANAQDGAGYNNANFATPPDGQRPRMRMYLWNAFKPMKDGDFENGIIIHEYGHGISNRLTGGPDNSGCLGSGQPGGMGEGWSDFFSLVLRMRPGNTKTQAFPMGDYVSKGGIRPYPYTTDMKVNPQTYELLNTPDYAGVHAIGSVWCSMLWEVYWNYVEIAGFDPDIYRGGGGNNLILADVVEGMKLQPCRPSLIDARQALMGLWLEPRRGPRKHAKCNAILAADRVNNNGKFECAIWHGFAKRGLGNEAQTGSQGVVEDFSVPNHCRHQLERHNHYQAK